MTKQTAIVEQIFVQLLDRSLQQMFQHLELNSHPRFATSSSGKGRGGSVGQMRASLVATQGLEEEHLHRDDRIGRRVSPMKMFDQIHNAGGSAFDHEGIATTAKLKLVPLLS